MLDYNELLALKEQNGNVILQNGLELNMPRRDYICMQFLQKKVLEVLIAVDEFCRDNNIIYYLGEGTLLGAVRHGGFIPWDDDVDILMPRADYERFLHIAKEKLPDGYALESMETNNKHWTVISQVQMTREIPYSKKRLEGIALYNGPCVDVFPLDFVPSDRSKEVKKRSDKIRVLRRAMWIKAGLHTRERYQTVKRRFKYYYPLKIYGKFRSLQSMYDETQRIMTATNDPSLGYVCVFGSLYRALRESFRKEYFGTPQYVEFEGHMLPIPSEPDKILKRIYGDYMQLPPVDKRKSKHFFQMDEKTISKFEKDDDFNKIFNLLEQHAALDSKKADGLMSVDNKEDKTKDDLSAIRNFCRRAIRKVRRIVAKKLRDMRRIQVAKCYNMPVLEKTILYDSFDGLGVLDSPRALFKRMLERSEFNDFTHVWAISNFKISKPNIEEFSDLDNVIFVKRNSNAYIRYLTTAKYLICNSSLQQYFARRPEQIYLNTWHGVPTKVMGYERPGERINATKNIVRNFLNTTHLIGANHFTEERMYKQAYLLDGIYEGKLLNEPLPRTDAICNINPKYVLEKLKRAGINPSKKIVLYAPTWKGERYNALDYDLDELRNTVKILRDNIDNNEYDVYLRVHYFLYREISVDEELKKICIPFTIDTNELLSVVDILISDYSSIFFDFLNTGKPILFYVPDIEDYCASRGLYIPMEELPGPVSHTIEKIADRINHIAEVKHDYADKYSIMRQWCCEKEDGRAADRIIDTLFIEEKSKIINCKNHKKKLLVMADFSKSFINEAALIEKLNEINYTQYDITLLTDNPKEPYYKQMLEEVDPHVRILINDKMLNCDEKDKKNVYNALERGKMSLENAVEKLAEEHEWQRLAGDSIFDSLCMLQPSSEPANWLLLSYVAPIRHKVFIQSESVLKSVFEQKNTTDHFDAVYDDIEQYFMTIVK